ncbi:hypothetical protein D9758_016111 [Tetrapyrgos nigripes]|uniref:Transmembrane protein n=1 Tax=Tetrapyrgos nigripes TaxID=182062 RepID=A0A8H5BZF1_9AGAR|nr:hypothetical protein D9758_016111 [Tetrapyrgos nigripes]
MVAFRAFSLVAALACAAFTYAAPVSPVENALVARCGCTPLPAIIGTLETSVTPLVIELKYLTSANATAEIVGPLVYGIKDAVNVAIGDVKVLSGVAVDTVLSTATGVLSLVDIAKIIASVVCLIFSALGHVLHVVSAVEKGAVYPLLCEVGALVGELLKLILALVADLLAVLLPLLAKIITVVVNLSLADVFYFLKL